MPGTDLEVIANELYGCKPDEFVAERDAAVAQAREDGDRDLARAIGKLRRPTRAAWLANLLARERADQLEGLLGLASGLVDAQRTLDGSMLRELSTRRHQLVAAMAREAGRLARAEHEPVNDSLLRELQGILEAALADPVVADEVRSGRLTRTLTYSGFGPDAEAGTTPTPAGRGAGPEPPEDQADAAGTGVRDGDRREHDERAERERAEREQAERERRERALADAEAEEAEAVEQQQADEAARDDAVATRDAARDRVAGLMSELDAAREAERAATTAAREAETAAKASARAAGAAAGRTARARARLDGGGPDSAASAPPSSRSSTTRR